MSFSLPLCLTGWALAILLVANHVCHAQLGFWEGPYDLPVIPVAVANLPDGKVLVWSAYDLTNSNRRGEGKTWTAIWDPEAPNVKPAGELIETTGHDSTSCEHLLDTVTHIWFV